MTLLQNMTVEPIHTAVPGRARFKVQGLYRSESLKEILEDRLPQRRGIERASANHLTGNVLVFFGHDMSLDAVASLIQEVVRNGADPRANGKPSRLNGASSRAAAGKGERPPQLAPSTNGRVAANHHAIHTEAPWHTMEASAVLAKTQTSARGGLSETVAEARLKALGPNVLPESEPRSALSILFGQFNSLPVALLSAAAGISIMTGGLADAVVIMGVVAINATIGFVTESQSERTIRSLKRLVQPTATVVRDGTLEEIPAERVVVGDILALNPGSYVAADCRLIEVQRLSIDESALTGESMPVSKTADALSDPQVPLPDRVNLAYMGTLVTGGQALAVVVGTGAFTEIGRIQQLAGEAQAPETPMQRQLTTLGNQLVVLSSAVCVLVFGIGILRGYGLLEMLSSSIALAVAAVPEGLPTVATTTLALGIRNMRRQHVLIRRLDAVETLGCIQTICLDKTGTLTLNRMAVEAVHSGLRSYTVTDGNFLEEGQRFDPLSRDEIAKLLQVCVLCSETQIEWNNGQYALQGSPTENALVLMAIGAGADVVGIRQEHPTLRVNTRAQDRNFVSSLHDIRPREAEKALGSRLLAVKGSPSEVLAMCRCHIRDGERLELTDHDRNAIETANERMGGAALRVLGCAYREVGAAEANGELESGLTWLGLTAMADPIRNGVRDLIGDFHRAGIDTVMITGDQSATAYAVGKDLGLSRNGPLETLDSTQLSRIEPTVLKALSERVHVFARVSPANKLQIVQALQRAGRVVAMTGDGINDGPALKAADIGVAMGTAGTDVAREAADVVLENDNLETMVVAISQGRTIYRNIRKSLDFQISTNLSEIIVVFVALAAGMGQPLNAMQLLWINLMGDIFPALALALEPPEADVMSVPPRSPDEPVIPNSDFARIGRESLVISGGVLGAYGYGVMRYGAGAAAASLCFSTLTLGELTHAVSSRSRTHSIFDRDRLEPNRYLDLALLGTAALQLSTLFIPGLRTLLSVQPISLADAGVIAAGVLLPFAANEAIKKVAARPADDATPRTGGKADM